MRAHRPVLVALTALAALLLSLLGVAPAGAVTDPLNGPYPQVHGELVTGLPPTPSCTTTIVRDFPFKDTAYDADPPFTGDYVPTCAGPWSRVVLTMSARVATGTQFDRIGDVLIGGAEVLHLTSAEGESGETSWTVQRDVTDVSSLLTSRQPTYFIIGNQTDGTYTGIFYGTLSLSFYAAGAGTSALPAADAVVPLSPGVDRGLPTRSGDRPLTSRVTVPANTTALTAQVFASGHGAEEEDWWDAPFACASGGVPYREVGVSIDGQLAGTAPVFPTVYTGGYGPDFWRPIPSPRAYDLRPYAFDLAPWIGTLTDGAAHTVDIAVDGQGGCDGYWFLGGNLLVTTNRASTARTTGSLTSYAGDRHPTSTTLGQQGTTLSDRTTSAHHLDVVGTVRPAGAALPTTVHVVQDLADTATVAALDVVSDWTWDSSSTRTTGSGPTVVDSQHSTYELVRDGAHWGLTDDQTTTSTTGTATTRSSTLTDTMQTVGPVLGVTGVVGSSQESWRFTSTDRGCADHELAAAAQNTVLDTLDTTCAAATPAGPGDPPAALPEVLAAALLPVTALALLGLALRPSGRLRRRGPDRRRSPRPR